MKIAWNFTKRGKNILQNEIQIVRYIIKIKCRKFTLSSQQAIANPSDAAEPANPMKCSEPIFDANKEAPT